MNAVTLRDGDMVLVNYHPMSKKPKKWERVSHIAKDNQVVIHTGVPERAKEKVAFRDIEEVHYIPRL